MQVTQRALLAATALATCALTSPALAAIGNPIPIGDFAQAANTQTSVSVVTGTCTGSASCTGVNVPAGDTVACEVTWEVGSNDLTTGTIGGISYTLAASYAGGDLLSRWVVAPNVGAISAGSTLTVNFMSTGNGYRSMACYDISGLGATPTIDQQNGAWAASSTGPSLPITPTISPSIEIAGGLTFLNGGGTFTQSTGFTALTNLTAAGGFRTAYRQLASTSTVTYAPAYASAVENAFGVLNLKPTASPPPPPPAAQSNMLLMGIDYEEHRRYGYDPYLIHTGWAWGSVSASPPPPPPGTCPFGSSFADGCAGAPPGTGTTGGTLYQNTAFFTYAKQSGQGNYFSSPGIVASHPPPWNMAGVDYAVGIPSSTSLSDPSVTQPSGCSYNPTGSVAGHGQMICGSNSTINGFDFSLHNGIELAFTGGATGTQTIENSKFIPGTNGVANQVQVYIPCACTVLWSNNYMNDNGFAILGDDVQATGLTGDFTIQYSAFLQISARPIAIGTGGNLLLQFNYIENMVLHGRAHGETVIRDVTGSPSITSDVSSFNTCLFGSAMQVSQSAACFYVTSGTGTPNYVLGQVDHNTCIINETAGATANADGCTFIGNATYGTVTLTANYIDPIGALACLYRAPGVTITTLTQSGNIDLFDGSTATLAVAAGGCTGVHP